MLARLQHEYRALFIDDEPEEATAGARVRRFARFWVMVGSGFARSRCPVRATALAYTSLIAFIPFLAVVVGILTGVLKSDAEKIRGWIDDVVFRIAPQLQSSPEFGLTLDGVVTSILRMIDNVNSGTLGTTGVIGLLAMILFMLARIEETLNDIWGVAQGRSWYARLVNYWASISLGPIVLVATIGFSTTLRLERSQEWVQHLPVIGSLLLRAAPVPLLIGACAIFYALMPNTKVQWRAALIGGLVAGVLWFANNELSTHFVSNLAQTTAIYGSLSIIPVFMAGLYLFWLILLFGAQVAYTFQHRRSALAARRSDRIHQEGRELVAVRIMMEAARSFISGTPAPTVATLAERLEIPEQLVEKVRAVLLQTRLLAELSEPDSGLVPARPPQGILLADILHALRRGAGHRLPTRVHPDREAAENALRQIAEAERAAGDVTLAELATRSPG